MRMPRNSIRFQNDDAAIIVISMRIQPQAVIFDYGNVLCQPQQPEEVQAMAAFFNASVDRFLSVYWPYRVPFDKADLSPEAYWSQVARDLGRTISDEQIRTLVDLDSRSWAHPDRLMIGWASDLRGAGIRTAILSNMPITLRQYLDCCCPWLPQFDQRTFSCDVRSCKPSPEIYKHTLQGLGVEASQALFLDDRADNVHAARALGIHAILFQNPEQAQCELESRFQIVVPLRS